MNKFIPVFSIFLISFLGVVSIQAAPLNDQVESQSVEFIFNQEMIFNAQFSPDITIKSANLVIKSGDIVSSEVYELAISPNNSVNFSYDFSQNSGFPAFHTIEYYYVLSTDNIETIESDLYSFVYFDNRFEWQSLDIDEQFIIHWYTGDAQFAQQLLDTAQNSAIFSDKYLLLPKPERLHIFVYDNSQTLREALNIPDNAVISGHATPEERMVMVSIAPNVEQTQEMERQIPHEISHVRLYAYIGDAYNALPHWLTEGLASLSELYPNPDFDTVLDTAAKQDELLSLSLLCNPFPTDARNAFLAYAQSQSFMRYIYETYGSLAIDQMISSYATGESCDNGPVASTGKTLSQLERGWQVWRFSSVSNTIAEDNTSPSSWVALMILLLVAPTIFILFNKRIQ